jgi:hypothetical protein
MSPTKNQPGRYIVTEGGPQPEVVMLFDGPSLLIWGKGRLRSLVDPDESNVPVINKCGHYEMTDEWRMMDCRSPLCHEKHRVVVFEWGGWYWE